MNLTLKLEEINYGDVAVKVMSLLGNRFKSRKDAEAKLIYAMSQIPSELIAAVFDAIPIEQKNEIVSSFATEYQSPLIHNINKLAWENAIGVTISDMSVNRDMEIMAQVENIDYPCLVERFLPMIKEKLLGMGRIVVMLRPVIQNASTEQLCGLLDWFFGENKDSLLASLVNLNQQTLISEIEDAAEKQNIRLKINSIFIQA